MEAKQLQPLLHMIGQTADCNT